jgi:hypothetical protein
MDELLHTATSAQADRLRSTLRRKVLGPQLGSFYVFCKTIMGYKDLTPSFHLPLCNDIQSTLGDLKRGYLEPRGSFKSTIVGKSYPAWRLLGGGSPWIEDILKCEVNDQLLEYYDKDHDVDPRNHRILILSEAQDIANKDLKDIKFKIENDQQFQWLFPEIIPESVTKTVWNAGEILLPRSQSFDESTLTALGADSAGTGFHYTIIVYEDLAGEKAAKSEPLMQTAKDRIKASPGLLVNPRTSEELFIATRWKHGTADVPGWMMQELPHGTTESGRPTGFKWHIRSAEEEGPDGERIPTFPEKYPIEVLDDIKQREGEYLYNCNYMNRPSSPEGSDFNPKLYKQFSIGESSPGVLDMIIPDDGTPPVRLRHLYRLGFYDPSSGGKTAKCEGAIAIVAMAADRRVFALRVWGKNSGYDEALEKFSVLNDQYVLHRRMYEAIGAQKEVENIVKMRRQIQELNGKCLKCEAKHRNFTIDPFNPGTQNKEERIRAFLGPAYEQGRFYVRKGETEFKMQMQDFPHGALIDRLDATASGVKHLRAPLSADEIESLQLETEAVHMPRESRTFTTQNYGGYV